MGVYSATIIPSSPSVSVQLANGVTYQQFQNSLGTYVYWFDVLYLFTNNPAQITQPILYNYTDVNGNAKVLSIIPTTDPYQFSSALYVNIKDLDIVVDGNSTVNFDLLPNTTLKLKLYGDVMSINALHGDKNDNFTELAKTIGDPEFFADTDFPPDYIL
jgi:hypothetical protein